MLCILKKYYWFSGVYEHRTANIQPFAISYRPQRYSAHYGGQGLVGHYASLLAGVEIGYLECASFKPFLIQGETVRIPTQELYLLPVLAEEDEHSPA